MNQISDDIVSRCLLANLREAVEALFELAESESHSRTLLSLVKNTIRDEFQKAAMKICEQINDLVQKYNDRECVIAGVPSEIQEVRDKNGHMDISENIWMEIQKIGVRRIGETAAFTITIDDKEVPGTGIPDDIAIRLFRAIDSFRHAKGKKENGDAK